MPNRIEHKMVNGIETKRCAECKEYLPLERFHKTGKTNTWDGRFAYCIDCTKHRRNDNINRKAVKIYGDLVRRTTWQSYSKKGIEVKINKADFVKWYSEHYFKNGVVDRIDDKGHYEIDNIHIITTVEHNIKKRTDRLNVLGVTETFGRYCYACNTEKPFGEFYHKKLKISDWNPLGLSEICKECSRQSRIDYYNRRKDNA